jgi:hypothetical protein
MLAGVILSAYRSLTNEVIGFETIFFLLGWMMCFYTHDLIINSMLKKR